MVCQKMWKRRKEIVIIINFRNPKTPRGSGEDICRHCGLCIPKWAQSHSSMLLYIQAKMVHLWSKPRMQTHTLTNARPQFDRTLLVVSNEIELLPKGCEGAASSVSSNIISYVIKLNPWWRRLAWRNKEWTLIFLISYLASHKTLSKL